MDGIVSVLATFSPAQQQEVWKQLLSDPNYLNGFLKEYVPQRGLLEGDVVPMTPDPTAQQAYNPNASALQNAHPMNTQQLAHYAQQAFNNQYAQHAAAYQHQNIQASLGKQNKPKRFMIQGKLMDLTEFLDTLYPEDCPERTYILLKFTEGENDGS